MKAKRVIFILDILNLTCFWNICQPLDVTGRNVISGGKGSQTDVVREVAAELKGTQYKEVVTFMWSWETNPIKSK